MYYLFVLFSGSWYSHCICCVIKSDGLFKKNSSHYLISQQYLTRLLTWLYMPSFLKHSSSLASLTHCSLIFPPTLAALSWHPT